MRRAVLLTLLLQSTIAGALCAQATDTSVEVLGWKQLVGGAAVLLTLSVADAPIATAFHGSSSPHTLLVARQFDRFGDETGIGPIIAGLALTGVLTHRHGLIRTALRAAESVALASGVTQGGKYLVGRVRPGADPDLDGSDFEFFHGSPAFPSGHSTAAFAMATTLSDAIGNPWATIGLYGLAAGTGWARLTEEKHWFTDVVAGGMVGVLSARAVEGRLRVLGIRAPKVLRIPHGTGLGWSVGLPPT